MTVDAARMHALACQYALTKTQAALDAALEACLPLCGLIARRFSGRGAEYDDLYQAACLACVNALKSFDPVRGFKFTTYVTPTVTGAVRNHLRDHAQGMRGPRAARERAAQLQKAREAHLALYHEEPSARALAQALGWDLALVLSVLANAWPAVSLDETNDEGLALGERLPALDAGFDRMEMRADLKEALAALTDTERAMLRLRFSLRLSQRDTAARLGRTQMQISRMERRVLAALRKEMTRET